jgi:hypothetical protein
LFLQENEGTQHNKKKTENDEIVREFLKSVKDKDRADEADFEKVRKMLKI